LRLCLIWLYQYLFTQCRNWTHPRRIFIGGGGGTCTLVHHAL